MIEPIYKELGVILMLWRHEAEVSQQSVADFLCLERTSVANIEVGRQRVMLHTIVDLAALMMIEPGDLINQAMERVRHENHRRSRRSASRRGSQ